MCQKSPKRRKVGDTLTAVVTPSGAAVTYTWTLNGTTVSNNTSYTVPATAINGDIIAVTVTDGTKTVSDSAIVVDDYSAEITLVDRNGLQIDGTALPTDILDVVYGADLGTPKTIIWYNNGAAKAVYTIEGAVPIQSGFDLLCHQNAVSDRGLT